MAGLGKGLGALLSESKNKKARQQNKAAQAPTQAVQESLLSVALSPAMPPKDTKASESKPKAKRSSSSKSTNSKVQAESSTKNKSPTTRSRKSTTTKKNTKAKSTKLLARETSVSAGSGEGDLSALAQDAAKEQLRQEEVALQSLTDSSIDSVRSTKSTASVSPSGQPHVTASDDHLVLNINLEMLKPSTYQPRHSFDDDAIIELATSIKEHGLLEPLIVKRIDSGYYEIICGERRYRAARMLSMDSVPCLVREVVDEKAYAIALIENIQRENLNPVELAIAFDQMMHECGMTQEEVAKSVCKSRSSVANYLRMLKLEDDALAALRSGQIDLGHAKVLLSLSGNAQSEACQIVIERGLSVRATESFVKEFAKKLEARAAQEAKDQMAPSTIESSKVFNYSSYEKMLNAKLNGAKAKFKTTKGGKGKLTLSYENEQELSALLLALGLSDNN